MNRIPRVCERCNSPFTAKPSKIAKGWARFCSIQCANAAKFGNPLDRFWKSVLKSDGCWLWTASLDKDGYGKFYADGKHIRAHVFSYSIHHGPIPEGCFVCHECDNPTCVRPDHIWLGNATANNRDTVIKGHWSCGWITHPERRPQGSRCGGSKLTERQILEIRQRYSVGGISQDALGKMYGVTQTCVSIIVRRVGWKHV